MITPELSDFLEYEEKESILKAISASDRIVSCGICQYLIEDEGGWRKPETGAAVVLFVKNSSERYYRIVVIEPSSEKEWEPTIQFDFLIKDKKFETIQMHAKLLVFEDHNGKEIGLHFYDSKECDKFHNSVCKRQVAKTTENQETPALDGKKPKKKKKSIFSFFHKEPKKVLEIGEPTNFRHVDGVKMTEGQEDLYMEVMSKLKTQGPEEEEIVRQMIVRHEDKFRQSMMVKKESQTVKVVKDKSRDKSKSFWGRSKTKIEDVSQPVVPVLAPPADPLKPDWNSDGSSAVASASSFSSASHRSSSTVTVTSSFKHSHTFAPDPIKNSDWDAPRKDTYGVVNQREPQNIYRFEQTEESFEIQKREIDERPPELPSRSTSRNVGEPISRTGLSTPRLPSHRGSYRWATQPETLPKQPPPISNSPHSHQVDEYAEIKLSSSKTPIRAAPPPPPATPPSLKTPISTTSSWRESSSVPSKSPSPKSAPPPPAPAAKSSSQQSLPPISNKSPPPPPPPLPTIATPSSVPPPPPPPPPPMIPQSDSDEDLSRPPSVRLSAVPESSTDRRSLMDQIRSTDRSAVLRKVSDTPDSRQSVVSPTSGTIVDQIQSFLDARRAGIHPSDSEGSDDEEDDEDWSD